MTSFWAVVPAAGVGNRMRADRPKQYLPLSQKTVLEQSLDRLLSVEAISGVMLALSANDPYWPTLHYQHQKPVHTTPGGDERCHSVLNALHALSAFAKPQDWVLVHDAARPCVRVADIENMITVLKDHAVGGLLGLPVADTLKFCNQQQDVERTVDRRSLWRALTPQMFRLGELREALQHAIKHHQLVTDDASAMELIGRKPKMIEAHADNIKITHPQDLALAEMFLTQQRVNA